MTSPGAQAGPAVRVEKLVKHYGQVQAVRGIDLVVQRGQVLGFVGPNGAGKSTTLRCLLDLIRPTSGRMEVLGLDPRRDGVELRGRIGYVPGELRLPERLTPRQLVASVSRLRGGLDDARHDAVVARLGIELDRRIRDLSSGNRRKVALLLALAARSELLVLDEPTSGLDPVMQHEFLGLIRDAQADGRAVLLSSHVLSEVQRAADRVVVLRAGEVVAEGSVDDLRRRARQRVEVWFEEDVPTSELRSIPGLIDATVEGRHLAATLAGPVDALLAVLARHRVASLVVQEPDLEDAFLDLYREPR